MRLCQMLDISQMQFFRGDSESCDGEEKFFRDMEAMISHMAVLSAFRRSKDVGKFNAKES